MNDPLEVYPYSIDKLIEIIADKSKNPQDVILNKLHHIYFQGYCDDIGVKTIVVENSYVDQHFLEDYSAYYVRCFYKYERFCTRVHFFEDEFTSEEMLSVLSGSDGEFEEKLKKSYLGFSVIKPLPQTVIGRTCLKNYPNNENAVRYFPSIRKYEINLFGINLAVESLAFQEQDRVAAACATSALWSVFQGTGKEFQHIIPSPVQITQAATEKQPLESRVLPNRGLTTSMMAHAIRHVGLEPDLLKVSDEYILKSTLYAYLKGRIPMILGIELWDTSNTNDETIGFHAVAVTGYRLNDDKDSSYGESGFRLRATRIEKIYVHDDQVGPFARMELDGKTVNIGMNEHNNPIERKSLSTSWIGKDEKIGSIRALPSILLVPLYHKIRIPFKSIHDVIISFDFVIEVLKQMPDSLMNDEKRLEWDIYLTTNNDVKTNIREGGLLKGEPLRDFLLNGMPHFLWRATAFQGDEEILDLFFDATDIEQGVFFLGAIEYDDDLSLFIRILLKNKSIKKHFVKESSWQIINWFAEQEVEGLDEHLSEADIH